MRTTFLAAMLTIAISRVAAAQRLDIGGIELRIGQDVTEVQRSLAAYQVRYDEGAKAWFVMQKLSDEYEFLGHFAAQDGKIAVISKGYRIGDTYETAQIYTQASRDIRRRAGTVCNIHETEYSDDLVHELQTQCGLYRLSYSFPWTSKGDHIRAGISITVKAMW